MNDYAFYPWPDVVNTLSNLYVRAAASNLDVMAFGLILHTNGGLSASSISNFTRINQFIMDTDLVKWKIPLHKMFPDPTGGWFADGIHLNTNGYALWARAMDDAIRGVPLLDPSRQTQYGPNRRPFRPAGGLVRSGGKPLAFSGQPPD